MSISECGLMDAIREKNYILVDRDTAKTPQEKREIYSRTVMADYYLMSTNAITMTANSSTSTVSATGSPVFVPVRST